MGQFTSVVTSYLQDPKSKIIPGPVLEPNEVREKAEEYSKEIISDWKHLRRIATLYLEALEKIWTKKGKKGQKHFLQKIWPNIPAGHRPDYKLFTTEKVEEKQSSSLEDYSAYIWPYVNQKDLSSLSLITFIRSRAQHPPSAFARADFDAGSLGRVMHKVPELAILEGYKLFLDGDKVETYGRLVSWDENAEPVHECSAGTHFKPGEGLRTLEIQQKIYKFLINCCDELLSNYLRKEGQLDQPDLVKPDLSLQKNNDTDNILENSLTAPSIATGLPLPYLVTILAEAPYRLPADPKFDRLQVILSARLSRQKYYMLQLRVEPGFFRQTLSDWTQHQRTLWIQHQTERLNNMDGTPDIDSDVGPHTAVQELILKAYINYEKWDLLHRLVSRLCELKEDHAVVFSAKNEFPDDFIFTLKKLRHVLHLGYEDYITLICESPSALQRGRLPTSHDDAGLDYQVIYRKNPKGISRFWTIMGLLADKEHRDQLGFENLIDAMENASLDPIEKEHISPFVQNHFSDLFIYALALHEVEKCKEYKETKKILRFSNSVEDMMSRSDFTKDCLVTGIFKDEYPRASLFKYPSDSTKENNEQRISAENRLHDIWNTFEANWKKWTALDLDSFFGNHPPVNRGEIERTKPWKDTPQDKAVMRPQTNQATSTEVTIRVEENDKVKRGKKEKIKTRGTPSLEEPIPEAEIPQPIPQPKENPKIKVPRHLIHVFHAWFHQPGQAQRGSISWNDVRKALMFMGFEHQKPKSGANVKFTGFLEEKDGEQTINFHGPHPTTGFTIRQMRGLGRHLTEFLNWEGDMFEEE